jgi:adenylate cyclase
MGSDLDVDFLHSLDSNFHGRWAVVNLEKGTNLTKDLTVLATLNEPADSAIRNPNYDTPEEILKPLLESRPYTEYIQSSEEMRLYIPIHNFKGTVALYVRYTCPTPYYATVRSMIIRAVVISIIGMVLTGLAFWVLYKGIRTPIRALVTETEKIKNFDLKDKVEISASLEELEKLIAAISSMKMGLQSFQKYVPADLVRQLIETHQEARIGGKLRELTVFFSDVADFTNITEDLAPNDLTRQLSEYFDVMTEVILRYRGTVDKYIGDAVMSFWGAPIDLEDHALLACRAAIDCQRAVRELSQRWKAEGKYEFRTRIGLCTGEIIVGNIGSEERLNYSVIGDTVNLASRLEGLNKVYHTSIIISEDTWLRCADSIEARLIDFVAVKGKTEPVRIYELIGEKGDISPRQKELLKLFSRAIDTYLAGEWRDALRLFLDLRERDPDDAVTVLYIERCEEFLVSPPGAEWRGFHKYEHK